ncbi:hypothetical protein LCGC14_1925150 [marine sediment metagenome]|uniref:Uncharacterized protein n=1 Tax=marine sediment metagenome TaxID=412755 RepID=A0A0F9I3H1_9ZZZZ
MPKIESIIRSPKGPLRRVVPLSEVQVPDLWGIAESLAEEGRTEASEQILECWYLCIDLLMTLRDHPDYRLPKS